MGLKRNYKFSFSLSKLLVRLPALRLMSAAVTEELFFTGLIGNVQIDSIIPYILKMESTDYNSQANQHCWVTEAPPTATPIRFARSDFEPKHMI